MTIDTMVLLAGILIWGLVQLSSMALATSYLGIMMRMMEKITDVAIKTYEEMMK